MRVAFIDDDPNELKILHTYFNDLTDPSTISIDDFSSGEEFFSRFTAGLYDLVILDIFMGDLTGGDVAHLRFSDAYNCSDMAWYLGCLFLPRKYQTAQRCQHSTLCHLLLFCSKCAGAFLIYSVVSKLVLEQQKIIKLQTRNHQLSTQTLDNTFSGSLDIDQELQKSKRWHKVLCWQR